MPYSFRPADPYENVDWLPRMDQRHQPTLQAVVSAGFEGLTLENTFVFA